MRQLVFVKKHTIEWRDVPDPVLEGKNQAIVRPLAVARCDLDLPIIHGQTLFRPGFALGHEFVGEVVQTSEDVVGFPPGTKVVVPFQVSCGSCPACARAFSRNCETTGPMDYGMGPGGKKYGGALAEKVLVPYAQQMLLKLPEGADLVGLASLSDNISEAWKLAGKYLANRLQPVLVLGGFASSIGLYTASLAKAMGAEVLYIDNDKERLGIAEKLGVPVEQVETLPKSWDKKFPIVVDANNSEAGFQFCLRSADFGGKVTSASIYWTNRLEFPYMDMYLKGASVDIGRVDSRETMPEILKWVASGKFNPGAIVTKTALLKDAAEAWLEPSIKLVITQDSP
ncbi:MAG: alcohol dehydrogenase catalytic domain-containing protein [Spirochaetia bacterium]|nr:alcohol dehydrogenase catalytic domain-containing protein [Spirochaetia bacterium]